MAPPIADIIEQELAAGSLRIVEGHLSGGSAEPAGVKLLLRTADGQDELHAKRLINCTGPGMNYRRVDSPLLQNLLSQGLVISGPLGGGLSSTRFGALIDARKEASSLLFNLGPGRLGTLLESIAIPEIRQQAVEIAAILTGRLRQHTAASPVSLSNAEERVSPPVAA